MIWVVVILLILILYGLAVCPNFKREKLSGLFAHRGLFAKDQSIPENTLPAFSAAIDYGYGIELDIQLSRDGVVYVFHDDDLQRLLKDDRKVMEVDSAELDQMDLHGQHIPRFTEVLKLVDGRAKLIVELKTQGARNQELCVKACDLLAEYKGWYCIESFDPRIVYWFSRHHRDVIRGQLLTAPSGYHPALLGRFIATLWPNLLTKPDFMAIECHLKKGLSLNLFARLGGTLVAWTVHETEDALGRAMNAFIFEHYLPKENQK